MSILRVGGQLARANGAVARVEPAPGSPTSDRDLLTMDDLTYTGAARLPQHTVVTSAMAIRYRDVSGNPVVGRAPTTSDVRHILLPTIGGDLVEYKMTTSFSTSTTAASLPTWTETRRWNGWDNYADISGLPVVAGGGAAASMFYFDPTTSALWYAWTPGYAGGPASFANMACVILDDAEARAAGASSGVTVSAGNVFGPIYFKSTSSDIWKDGTQGVTPIPSARQADFGGMKFLTAGGNTSNIGDGARGVAFWVAPAYPDVVASPPADNSVIWSTATNVYKTGPSNGIEPPAMWRPANTRWPGGNTITASLYYVTAGGVYSTAASGGALQLGVGDCLYFSSESEVDTVNVRMTTPAAGGTCVVEYNNGSTWVQPTNVAIEQGSAAMTGTHNVYTFDPATTSNSQPHASMLNYMWWRLRRTGAGSSGGSCYGVYTGHSRTAAYTGAGTTRPEPVGGYIGDPALAIAAYNADKDASHGFAYAPDYVDGTCYVRTAAVEGILVAGKFGSRNMWYGMSSLWAQTPDRETGTAQHYVDSLYGPDNANGNWASGKSINYFMVFDATKVAEAYAGTRAASPAGYNPEKFYHVRDYFSHPVDQVAVSGSEDAGETTDTQQTFGQAMIFDEVNNQVLYFFTRSGGTEPYTMVWDVRNS